MKCKSLLFTVFVMMISLGMTHPSLAADKQTAYKAQK